jgi:hypothetical protein
LAKLLLHARETQADKNVDSSHIDFVAISKEERKQFSSDINIDLEVLRLSRIDSLDVCQERLSHALELLGDLEEIQLQMDAGEYAGAWILIRQAIPVYFTVKTDAGKRSWR